MQSYINPKNVCLCMAIDTTTEVLMFLLVTNNIGNQLCLVITYVQEILIPGLQAIDMVGMAVYLGRHGCVVLPSCAMAKIMQVFPSE